MDSYASQAGSATLKALLMDRSRAPPSPDPSTYSTDGGFSPFTSPQTVYSPSLHFPQHHRADDWQQESLNLPTPFALPSSPRTSDLNGVDGTTSDSSAAPSPASVRIAKRTRLPTARSEKGAPTVESFPAAAYVERAPRSDEVLARPRVGAGGDRIEGNHAFPPTIPPKSTSRTSSLDKLSETRSLASSTRSDSVRTARTTRNASESTVTPLVHSSGSWRAGLDATIKTIVSNRERDPRMRPEEDAQTRMMSLLGAFHPFASCGRVLIQLYRAGPKVKMISRAPWDSDDSLYVPPRRGSDAGDHHVAASMSSRNSSDKDGKVSLSSRARSLNIFNPDRKSAEMDELGDDERSVVGVGLGFGDIPMDESSSGSLYGGILSGRSSSPALDSYLRDMDEMDKDSPESPLRRPQFTRRSSSTTDIPSLKYPTPTALPTPPASATRPRPGAPRTLSTTSTGSKSSPTLPHSAPANITSFSTSDMAIPRSGSGATLTVDVARSIKSTSPSLHSNLPPSPPSPTASFAPRKGLDAIPLTGKQRPGYQLISLESARAREIARVSAAAAHRKAMLPVENIAVVKPRPREVSASTVSKVLRPKKSGFLKRMMGGDKTPTMGSAPVAVSLYEPEEDVVESFRMLPDDYVHDGSPLPPVPTIVAPSVTVSTSFPPGSHPGITPVKMMDAKKPHHLATPSLLSLRPVSMAFSAGLVDFLAEGPMSPPSYPLPTILHGAHSFKSSITSSSGYDDTFSSTSNSTSTTPTTSPSTLSFNVALPPFNAKQLPDPALYRSASSATAAASESIAIQDQFARAKQAWRTQQWDLESQIKALKGEVERLKVENAKGRGGLAETGSKVRPPRSIPRVEY